MSVYSLKQIKKSFDQKRNWEKQFPVNYYFVRPLSFLATYFIIRLTDSPSKVAWVGFSIGSAGCMAFAGISIWSVWPSVVLLAMFSFLDAVDGNIARTSGKVTYYGKFLDGSIGELIEGSYCFCLGLGLSLRFLLTPYTGADGDFALYVAFLPLVSGSIIMAGRLYGSFIDLKYEYHFLEKQRDENKAAPASIHDRLQTSTYSKKWYFNFFVNINLLNNQIIALIVFAWLGRPAIFLHLLALYYLVRLIVYFTFFVYRAQQRLI